MLLAQNMLLTEHIVELVYVYGISFMHIFIISMFILTFKIFQFVISPDQSSYLPTDTCDIHSKRQLSPVR
jgi:uncharacterized membrane protein